MNMIMTFKELETLYAGIQQVEHLKGVKFAYCIAKNKRLIDQELKIIDNIIRSSDEFKVFERKRLEILDRYTLRDEKGNKVTDEKGNPKFTDENAVFTEYSIISEPFTKYEEEVKSKEVMIDLHNILLADIPQDISMKQIDNIMFIIKE